VRGGEHRRWGLGRCLPAAFALVAVALAYGGCAAPDESPTAPAVDGGMEATAPPDVDVPDAAPQGCAADRAEDGMWQHLSCAGLYTDFAAKVVDPSLRPYKPGLELWSDGAAKQRWLALPAGTKIDTSNVDEWVFPNGTRAWKEFKVDGKRVETRLYEKGVTGTWRHATFVWNADESEAVRTTVGVKVARGGVDVPPYEIPNDNQCNACHAGRKDKLLGLEAVSLGLPGAEGLALSTLVADGIVTTPPSSTSLVFPEDATGKAAAALAWVHMSCGPCHNRSADANAVQSNVFLLTRASALLGADGGAVTVAGLDAFTTTVGKTTMTDIPDGGGATFSIIKAGDPSASLASYLSGRRVGPTGSPNEKEQMPPIVTRLVDANGHALFDAWISALPP
jgi:hypothetical protein